MKIYFKIEHFLLTVTLILSVFFFVEKTVFAQDRFNQLSELSLEDLMDIEITSVSKKEQKVLSASAAIFVITSEDIHRSSASSIPELLRMVPGLNVAQINSNKWAISSRGFNGLFANKLLVLIDGRSVYTPLFSGVYWNVQDTLLADIERIEVIRGPGAVLWGANAVNGVINIITKNAADTQGGFLSAGGGTEEKAFGSLRYGLNLGKDTNVRFYTKAFSRDDTVRLTGDDSYDKWEMIRGGFRLDTKTDSKNTFQLQGDIYDVNERTNFFSPANTTSGVTENKSIANAVGFNVLGKWSHNISETSDFILQTYFDRVDRVDLVDQDRETFDIDLQHSFRLGDLNDFVWGASYRLVNEKLRKKFLVSFDPKARDYHLVSFFAQDDISIVKEKLTLTIGSKLEHHTFTGYEFQPSMKIAWNVTKKNILWASVSRAVRTPSRTGEDVQFEVSRIPTTADMPATAVTIFGNSEAKSENLTAYEVGYRASSNSNFSLDINTFYYRYDDYTTIESSGAPFVDLTSDEGPLIIAPYAFMNNAKAETYGIEAVVNWKPVDRWRLQASYSYINISILLPDSVSSLIGTSDEKETPQNMATLRSMVNFYPDVEFDSMLRYVDKVNGFSIDSYIDLDVRLAWHPYDNMEISFVGKNLLDNAHAEYVADFVNFVPAVIERSGYGEIKFKF